MRLRGNRRSSGKNRRRRTWFQPGHASNFTRCKEDDEISTAPSCLRLSKTDFDQVVEVGADGFCLEINGLDNQPLPRKLLRPLGGSSEDPTSCLKEPTAKNGDEYRIFHKGLLQNLFNEAYREHPGCEGELIFDHFREKKVGLAWQQGLKCTVCMYQSRVHKLYREVYTGKPGRRPAELNLALQVGLSQSPAGNCAARVILNSTGIPAPSASGLQKSSNKVSQVLVSLNEEDMEHQRQEVKRFNILRGITGGLAAETDCMYNVPMSHMGSRTPMQPATQVICTITENVTKSKKIIGVSLSNKHCSVGDSMRARGIKVSCPNHSGYCGQNVEKEDVIGNEARNVEIAYRNMQKKSHTPVKVLTTDGDSRALSGVNVVNRELGFNPVVSSRDTRHLSEDQGRFLKRQLFSKNMFPGRLKAQRDKVQKNFSDNLKRRCYGEFNIGHKVFGNDTNILKKKLNEAAEAVVECFSGHCGDKCNMRSFVCEPKLGKAWQHSYLGEGEQLSVSAKDKSIIRKAIAVRLAPEAVEKTKYNKNTQKSEANNRSIRRSLPKNILMKRNATGRLHGTVHRLNNGVASSTLKKLIALGVTVPSDAKTVEGLLSDDKIEKAHKKRQQSEHYKARRRMWRERNFKIYKERSAETAARSYAKGLLSTEDMRSAQVNISIDHSYSSPLPVKLRSNYSLRSKDKRHAALSHPSVCHDHSYA